jgi:hypothetical protein
MNVKRIAALCLAGAVLAAMIAGATTSGTRRAAAPPRVPNTTGVELKGAELAAEIARLRARLRPTSEPQEPARNLFQFGTRGARPGAMITSPTPAPEAVPEPPPTIVPPPFVLVGLATDSGPDGPVRTAILSGFGELFIVKEGEPVGSQFKVASISGEGVDLINLTDSTTLKLVLK